MGVVPLMMIDTQIVSYAYRGRPFSIAGSRISSVVAHEFLEVYHPGWATRFRYYIKYYHSSRHGGAVGFSPARWKSAMLERLVLDFGRDHPQLIEFNSKATAAIINDRNVAAYGQVLESLDKASKKKLRPRFAFLCMQVSECVPLVAQTADLGIELLWRFVQQHNLKGTFRNSVNDMLILAAAIASKDDLITEDNLLTRFAARERGAAIQDAGRGTIRINFGTPKVLRSAQSGESKGYINRGWRIAEDFRRAVLPQH
jgi:predicted nucleic acid-binding protein